MTARTGQQCPISTRDARIAAVALVHGMAPESRHGTDFRGIDGLTKAWV